VIKGWFPNLNSAVMAWAQDTRIFVVGKRQEDYKTYETYYEYKLKIFRVPSGQQLEMKKEGQRSWNNETIYTDNSVDINVDDIIYFEDVKSKRYRIMNKTDYTDFGFVKYEIMSDYG